MMPSSVTHTTIPHQERPKTTKKKALVGFLEVEQYITKAAKEKPITNGA